VSDEYSIHSRFLMDKLDAAGYEDKMAYERGKDCTFCLGLGFQANALYMPKRSCAMCNGTGRDGA
jgi:DnaJ-class molecular chaperone